MLEKIASLSTLRNLTGLTKSLVRPGNVSLIRCYSLKSTSQAYSSQLYKLSLGPIAAKNSLCPNASQLTKIAGNNLIQKRWSTHDHVNLWKFERIVSALFIPVLPLCFMLDNAIFDSLLAVLSVVHVHWGLEAIIVDYARPIVVGPLVPKICFFLLYLTSAVTLAGLLVLAINGPGISKVIKQGWAIGHEEPIKEDPKKKGKK